MRHLSTGFTALLIFVGWSAAFAPPAFADPAPPLAAPAAAAPATVAADGVWRATHTLLPGDILQTGDLAAAPPDRRLGDTLPTSRPLLGLEVKRRVYDGRVLTERDVGPRSAVKENMVVDVVWQAGTLSLAMSGRALESGAVGDHIRVLNTTTARTIRGVVIGDGTVELQTSDPDIQP